MNTEQREAMTIIKNHTADCSGGKDFVLPMVQEALEFIEGELERLDAMVYYNCTANKVEKRCSNCASWNKKCSDENTLFCKDWKVFVEDRKPNGITIRAGYDEKTDGKIADGKIEVEDKNDDK